MTKRYFEQQRDYTRFCIAKLLLCSVSHYTCCTSTAPDEKVETKVIRGNILDHEESECDSLSFTGHKYVRLNFSP